MELVIHLPGGGAQKSVNAAPGMLLSDVLHEENAAPAMPCGGKQRCGKCVVWVRGAAFAPADEKERALLAGYVHKGLPAGAAPRLACFCRLAADAGSAGAGEVWLPPKTDAVVLEGGTAVGSRNAALQYDGGSPGPLGIAVDIGTTTVTAALYELETATLLATQSGLNAQAPFGADVLSRIVKAGELGVGALQAPLLAQLNSFFAALFEGLGGKAGSPGHSPGDVGRLVITGNTTMLHFVEGLDPAGIGVSPFVPQSLFGRQSPAAPLFPLLQNASLYLPRSVSAYVGSDITCGIEYTGMARDEACTLLVDVGTNGEMALCKNGKTLCCATAAGPAFEGAEIAMGMPAAPGAVSRVAAVNGGITVQTVANAAPVGICGTGIISAVDVMLKTGALSDTGEILEDGHPYTANITEKEGQTAFVLGGGVLLTQQDIRQVQLAKAAIAAGIHTLLHESATPMAAVQTLYLSGGFGSYINPAEAAGMGLIPPELAGKAKAVGNSALGGAVQMLFDESTRQSGEDMAKQAEEVSLSANSWFMDEYIEQMGFEGGAEG